MLNHQLSQKFKLMERCKFYCLNYIFLTSALRTINHPARQLGAVAIMPPFKQQRQGRRSAHIRVRSSPDNASLSTTETSMPILGGLSTM